MTTESKPLTEDAKQTTRALERAARRARELAERTGTPCYVVRDGRIVDVTQEKDSQIKPNAVR
jgi:diaminopimelate decarboxylase